MTFDLGRLASIAILALVSSAVALEAPRTSDKAALAACLNKYSRASCRRGLPAYRSQADRAFRIKELSIGICRQERPCRLLSRKIGVDRAILSRNGWIFHVTAS